MLSVTTQIFTGSRAPCHREEVLMREQQDSAG
jgi:hypothetical protein